MVIIATDSAADFEMEELKKMNVTYLPMSVMFGEDQYLENISIAKEEFFERLQADPHFPKTSQSSVAIFEELFEKAKENGDEVVYLPLSSGLSGDYMTAMSVKNMVDYDGIYVIDTLTCTGGQRLLVEKAVKMRDEGCDGKAIAEKMESLKEKADHALCRQFPRQSRDRIQAHRIKQGDQIHRRSSGQRSSGP